MIYGQIGKNDPEERVMGHGECLDTGNGDMRLPRLRRFSKNRCRHLKSSMNCGQRVCHFHK